MDSIPRRIAEVPAAAVVGRDFHIPGPGGRLAVRLHRPAGTAVPSDGVGAAAGDPDHKFDVHPGNVHPADGGLPLVLYLHGGGFVAGTLDDADVPARSLAALAGAAVLCAEYALAPARPFPAAPEDAYAALLWTARHAAALGADAARMAVAGDDAGGNLAACLALMARDRGEVGLAAQVLIAPMLDPSMTCLDGAPGMDDRASRQAHASSYRQYLPGVQLRLHPYAAPLECRRLAGLPAAFVATGAHDALHCEAERYAAALIAAGVPVQAMRYPGLRHEELACCPQMLQEAADFLRRRLAVPARHAFPLPDTPIATSQDQP